VAPPFFTVLSERKKKRAHSEKKKKNSFRKRAYFEKHITKAMIYVMNSLF